MDSQSLQHKLVGILIQKHGFETIDYASIRQVSQKLRPEFKISENTLARIAGLRNDNRTHYRHTLNVVAKAAGFISYEKYEQIAKSGTKLQMNVSRHPHAPFFTSYAGIAARENDTRYLQHLTSYIDHNGISISEHFSLGEHILQGIRQNKQPKKTIDCLVAHPTLVDIYLKWWVDMDYLDKYYGKAMQELSKKKNLPITDYFFANTIAFEYEWKNKLEKQSLRRASRLTKFNLSEIVQLIDQHDIFPAARWIKVALKYYRQTGNKNKWEDLLDFSLSLLDTLQADEAIILISQLSELDVILPVAFRKKIEVIFLDIKDQVKYEWDSLANAGLNLQRMTPKNKLMTADKIKHIMDAHPRQVFCSKNRLIQKLRYLKD